MHHASYTLTCEKLTADASRNVGGFILAAISSLPPSSRSGLHFYTSSGGNAGLAAVLAAASFGYPCTVVVPLSTTPLMLDKLRLAGASEVVQKGATWAHADAYLRQELIKDETDVYVPPFDHETIWEAASGIVEESERQLAVLSRTGDEGQGQERVAPDVIICSVGGGGLFSGIALGVERSTVSSKPIVLTSETIGADSLISAVEAKQHIKLDGITSIATSLGAVQVCKRAYDYAMDGVVDVRTRRVSDKQAVRACVRFANEERFVVEPACGAALALLYDGVLGEAVEVNEDTKVVVVVCGGSNVNLGLLGQWAADAE